LNRAKKDCTYSYINILERLNMFIYIYIYIYMYIYVDTRVSCLESKETVYIHV